MFRPRKDKGQEETLQDKRQEGAHENMGRLDRTSSNKETKEKANFCLMVDTTSKESKLNSDE